MVDFVPLAVPLFVPATRDDRFEKADASGADALILDLEDAVSPDDKVKARQNLSKLASLNSKILVRVNAINSPWFEDDIKAVSALDCAGIMLPKAACSADFGQVSKLVGTELPVIALVETALGLANQIEMSNAPNLKQIAFGSIDFALDIDCRHERDPLLFARSELVFKSRLADLPAPLDGVTADISDLNMLEADCEYANNLGFGGKLAIHPKQVETIRSCFQPSAEEINWAKRIVEAVNVSASGVVQLDGEMVDAPVIKRARRILARSK